VYKKNKDETEVIKAFSALIKEVCPDEELAGFLQNNNFDFYKWTGLNILLWEYELYLLKNSMVDTAIPSIQYSDLSIEHVLPEKCNTSEWITAFGQSAATYVHLLGNLAFLERQLNIGIHNNSFAMKKQVCFKLNKFVHLALGILKHYKLGGQIW